MKIDGTRSADRATELVLAYYAAFNRGDWEAMLALLTDDVVHDINQGGRETGRAAFGEFLARMRRSYRERLRDVVVMTTLDGERAAAEYVVDGEYIADDETLAQAAIPGAGHPPGQSMAGRSPAGDAIQGISRKPTAHPPARGQTYALPGGGGFEIRDGRIARISNYYNLQDWLRQIA